MLIGEATNTYCIVFGWILLGQQPTISHIRDEYAHHYTTYAV